MTEVVLAWSLLHTPELSVWSYDYAEQQLWDAGGGIFANTELFRTANLRLLVSGGVSLSSSAYTIAVDEPFHVASWTLELEATPRWYTDGDRLRGFWECGLGLNGRIGLPDLAPGVLFMGVGGHTSLGLELGSQAVRPMVAVRFAFTGAPGYASGEVTLPDAALQWSFYPSTVRVMVQAGAAFGGR